MPSVCSRARRCKMRVCVSGCGPWWDARAERSVHGQRCRHPPVSPQFCCSFGSFFTIANSKISFWPWCLQRRQGWHARALGIWPRSGVISTTETLTQLVFRNLSLRPRVRPMRHSEQHAARSDAGVGSSSCMSQKDTPMLLLKSIIVCCFWSARRQAMD
jgi:hypothetical protein